MDQTIRENNKWKAEQKEGNMANQLIKSIKSINVKDLLSRAAWTFLQAFLAVFLFTAEPILDLLFAGDWSGLKALLLATLIAAIAAGLSALKTLVLQVVKDLKSK